MQRVAGLDLCITRAASEIKYLDFDRNYGYRCQWESRQCRYSPGRIFVQFLSSHCRIRGKFHVCQTVKHGWKFGGLIGNCACNGPECLSFLQGRQLSLQRPSQKPPLVGQLRAGYGFSSFSGSLARRSSTTGSRSSQSQGSSRRSVLCSSLQQDGYLAGSRGTADLCLFPCSSVFLPTSRGTLNLFESKYLHLLDVIKDVALSARTPPRFGVVLRNACESPLDESPSDSSVGCCCIVESDGLLPDGTTWVQYVGVRRFRIRTIHRTTPFQVATVEWLDDKRPDQGDTSSGARIDRLEREVWQMCCKVASLTARLDARSARASPADASLHKLPATVRQFAPVPPVRTPVVGAAQKGVAEIQVWRQSGRDEMNSWAADQANNPYWAARERMAKPARQEAFSFAAASMVDLGPSEKLDLVRLQDTGARLAWVEEAIVPHLAALQAKHALLAATEKM